MRAAGFDANGQLLPTNLPNPSEPSKPSALPNPNGGGSPSNGFSPAIIPSLQGLFGAAENTKSPLVLDLDGDGVETIGKSAGIHFDQDKNGFAETSGWVGKDDGLLVWDRNGNGKIDDGGELFGNNTVLANGQKAANGFEALKELDSNKDGKVDASDTAYASLRVWKDANSDGIASTGELLSLAQAGVKSLNTGYTTQNITDAQGNQHLQAGSFTRTDGSTAKVDDVWFAVDTARTVDKSLVAVSADIAALPDLAGFGNVHSLHQAMARDTTAHLKNLVQKYANTADPVARKAVLTTLIYAWAGVENIDPASRAATKIYGNVIGDARKLATLEAFLGESYQGTWCWGERDPNPHGQAAPILLDAFDRLAAFMGVRLMMQTQNKGIYDAIGLTWNATTNSLELDVSGVAASLKAAYAADSRAGTEKLLDFVASVKTLGDFGGQVLDKLRAAGDPLGAGFDFLLAYAGRTLIKGDANANALYGADGSKDDIILGMAGNDTLYGYGGNDVLNGGTGNDYLNGGTGNDTYLFARGDGQDTISEYDTATGNTDTIRFAAGIAASDITASRDSGNLCLSINGTGDKITVQNWFYGSAYRVEQVQFADGTTWDTATIQSLAVYLGTDNADYLYGTEDNETFIGKGGNDYLIGNGGSDTLNGGTGNDYLVGGTGNDTYLFRRGDGQDTINEYDYVASNTDTIRFAAGIAASDITASRDSGNLCLSINGTGDKITVQNWFYGSAYRVEQVQFADGTTWNTATLQAAAYMGTDNADYLYGTEDNETFIGKGGNDYLIGNGGSDTLNGGTGNDYLVGGTGNDTYLFARGDGQDTINEYDYVAGNTDTIRFAAGIAASDITASRDSGNLYLSINGTGDKITVQNWFSGSAYRVEQVQFADGTTWNTATLQAAAYMGTDNADYLYGTSDNETFIGKRGNDYLVGGTGNDTYLFRRGDGQDTINEYDYVASNTDTIRFAAGIAASDITASRDSGNLYLSINGTSDKITVQNWFSGNAYRVEQVQFADGTTWDTAMIQLLAVYLGTDGADYLYGTEDNETFIGRGGNDYLVGNGGSDTLNGGTGNDTLSGSTGNDVYIFARGDGQDTISDYDTTAGNTDTIRFAPGIAASDITASRDQGNLYLCINGTADKITVQNWFSGSAYRVEQVQFADGTVWNAAALQAAAYMGTDNADYLYGTKDNETFIGKGGNDYLAGNGGSDTLNGGTGNDYLVGGTGNDTYLFRRGDGQDTINEYDYVAGNTDTIRFAAGIAASDITASRDSGNLYLSLNGTSDRITVQNWFYGSAYRVEQVQFADGTTWDTATIQSLAAYLGTDNADYLYGTEDNETFIGKGGNDYLIGNGGNDTLNGGTGNDTLYGGTGNDTYLFSRGDGQDTISEYNTAAGNTDTIRFAAGIAASDITASRDSGNLYLSLNGTSDRITVQNWFYGNAYRVEQVQFADGTTWNTAALQAAAYMGTDGADYLYGTSDNETLIGRGGNDYLIGNGGNDALNGGTGNDYLDGGTGNDILEGADGNDTLNDNAGNNLFSGGSGADALTGSTGNELSIGGTGNDTITTGVGADLIAFNRGDGQDTVNASTGLDNTLSLGRGIAYSDLAFSKSANDLVISTGANESITFQDWYASTANRSVVTLQVIAEAMAGYGANSADSLLDKKVQTFDFSRLVNGFDTAKAKNPTLASWNLMDSLLDAHLASSDGAALGGDLAYQYGMNGALTGMGMAAAQDVLAAAQFGSQAQALRPWSGLSGGAAQLS